MTRVVRSRYSDPVDLVWLACAARLGFSVRRDDAVYASFDGERVLTIAPPADFDADDSLAQMIFHELCHGLVARDADRGAPDWGLDNTDDRDLVWEHACHRLQATLADAHGLRAFMAVTTDWRPYWDALPADPLAPCDDPAAELARAGWERSRQAPWRAALDDALAATAAIAAVVRPLAPADSLWALARPLHPLGRPIGSADATCGGCAWRHRAGPGPPVARCRRHPAAAPPAGRTGFQPALRAESRPTPAPSRRRSAPRVDARVDPDWPACDLWEPPLTDADCADCGACCRQGFGLVPVSPRSRLARERPDLVTRDAFGLHLPRPDGFCVALDRGPADGPPYRCRVYPLRPSGCSDFEVGGAHCLDARRRVGLSR